MSGDSFRGRDLLDVESLSAEDVRHILDAVPSFKEVSERDIKKVPTLRGKTVINLFFEPSTRTRTSFEIAGKRLSADVVNVSVATSSVSKGESLRDMADNLAAMHADVLVVRHQVAGVPHMLARAMTQPVINAGDGAHEHPTQALLDVFTLQEKLGPPGRPQRPDRRRHRQQPGGAVQTSRPCAKLGMRVCVCGPRTMLPAGLDHLGVEWTSDFDAAIPSADAVMMLRVQRERHSDVLFPSLAAYGRALLPDRAAAAPRPRRRGRDAPGTHQPRRRDRPRRGRRPGVRHPRAGDERRGRAHGAAVPDPRGRLVDLLIRGGRVVDPEQGLDGKLDVLVAEGRVAAVGRELPLPDGAAPRVVDARGWIVAPGFIDMHVHFGEPGYEHRETIASGLAAAAAGGFTAVAMMADTQAGARHAGGDRLSAAPRRHRLRHATLSGGRRDRPISRARRWPKSTACSAPAPWRCRIARSRCATPA